VRFAVAYGSGALKQRGYGEGDAPMLDLIFAVDDPREWHKENIRLNIDHYSVLSTLGLDVVCRVQDYGPGIYYNTMVRVDGYEGLVKYGVISTERLIQDLTDWEHLYVSGRLQKPVDILVSDNQIEQAMQRNYSNALLTATLLLPYTFTTQDLFLQIADLSYAGDVRVGIAENPEKVPNIVIPHIDRFTKIYTPALAEAKKTFLDELEGERFRFKFEFESTDWEQVIARLPRAVREGVKGEERLRENHRKVLQKVLGRVVRRSSWQQTTKGLITAGLVKSLKYVLAKVRKRFRQL